VSIGPDWLCDKAGRHGSSVPDRGENVWEGCSAIRLT
jgi:hypothetical protein